MKTISITFLTLCGALAGTEPLLWVGLAAAAPSTGGNAVAAQANETAQPNPAVPVTNNGTVKSNVTAGSGELSAGLNDVARLAKAGLDESVILAFVQHSGIAYRLNAQEVVRLQEVGVSSAVVTAMLQQGASLRQQAARSQTAAIAAAAAQKPTVVTAPSTVTYSTPVVYTAPSPTVVYAPAYPSSSYAVASYGYAPYYAPRYYYPSYYSRYPGSYWSFPRVGIYAGFSPRLSVGVGFGGGNRFAHGRSFRHR